METFLALVPLFMTSAAAALGLGLAFVSRRQRLQGWKDAAAACGLQALEASGLRLRLTARSGPLDAEIRTCGSKGRRTRLIVRIQEHQDFHDVSIRREPLLRRGGQEVEIGDRSFDLTFRVEGPMPRVLALLDAETRRLIRRVNGEGELEISGAVLRVEGLGLSDDEVPHVLPLLLDIGRRLVQPMDIPRRLAENAREDPEPGVRLRNLLVLAREYPGEPGTAEALRTACSDPSPQVRLRGAQELGAEGRGVLLRLVESLEDDAVSAAAVSALARELPFERTKAILDQAQDRSLTKTARACLEALGQKGASPGQLSVADAGGGELSLASSEIGRLSLEQAEAGLGALAVEPFPLPPEEPEPRMVESERRG